MAEWLGNGLQNRVQQFESAWHLPKKSRFHQGVATFFVVVDKSDMSCESDKSDKIYG